VNGRFGHGDFGRGNFGRFGYGGGYPWGYLGYYDGLYGGLYSSPYYDNSYYFGPSGADVPPASAGTDLYSTAPLTGYQTYDSREPVTAADTATITVQVPVDAEVWFDDTKMSMTGARREFVTPQLTPGQTYSYKVRARWTQGGRVFDESHPISFHAGQAILVNFVAPAAKSSKTPSTMEKAS
jgi:uncharacterized protein (TIGR03000 family)